MTSPKPYNCGIVALELTTKLPHDNLCERFHKYHPSTKKVRGRKVKTFVHGFLEKFLTETNLLLRIIEPVRAVSLCHLSKIPFGIIEMQTSKYPRHYAAIRGDRIADNFNPEFTLIRNHALKRARVVKIYVMRPYS